MTWRTLFRRHQQARLALNRPELQAPAVDDHPPPPRVPLVDAPRIESTHPNWWQVHRVEVCGLEKNYVLIAEVRTETEAFKVAAGQASQVRIRKWGAKAKDYLSPHDPLLVVTGTVRQAEE